MLALTHALDQMCRRVPALCFCLCACLCMDTSVCSLHAGVEDSREEEEHRVDDKGAKILKEEHRGVANLRVYVCVVGGRGGE